MIRRPPRSTRPDTLFPYPTLSRSRLFGDDRPDVAVLGHRHAADIGKHMAHAQNLAAMALEEGGELARVEVIGIVRQRFVFGRRDRLGRKPVLAQRSEEHTSELQSLMRISYAVFCLKKKKTPI